MNSKKNIWPAPEPAAGDRGFTLIEMIIALTILALVVTVLYLAFSTAGRIWSRQQLDGGTGERESVLARLLQDDFASLVPYSYNDKKGAGFFFALSPKALFYATTSAYGARERVDGGLYFACLFLREGEGDDSADPEAPDSAAGGQTLYLVKELGPKNYLVEALHRFVSQPGAAELSIDEKIRERAIPVLQGLDEASFAVVIDPEKIVPGAERLEDGALQDEKRQRRYSRKTLPSMLLFQYRVNGRQRRLFLEATVPPPLPEKKKNNRKKTKT